MVNSNEMRDGLMRHVKMMQACGVKSEEIAGELLGAAMAFLVTGGVTEERTLEIVKSVYESAALRMKEKTMSDDEAKLIEIKTEHRVRTQTVELPRGAVLLPRLLKRAGSDECVHFALDVPVVKATETAALLRAIADTVEQEATKAT